MVQLYTTREVGMEVGLSKDGVGHWVELGALRPDYTTVGGQSLFSGKAIERFRRIRERRLKGLR